MLNKWVLSGAIPSFLSPKGALYIYTKTIANGRVNDAYSATLEAKLGIPPYSWSVVSGALPPGLTLTSTQSVANITGTPEQTGVFTFTAQVCDSHCPTICSTRQFTVEMYSQLAITNTGVKTCLMNIPYSETILVAGGELPYTFRITQGQLPTGLYLNPDTGHISGQTSLPPGNSTTFTVTVTDYGNPSATASKEFVIHIVDPLSIVTQSIPNGMQEASYTTSLQGSGGISPHHWFLQTGSLPAGITLNEATGVISGIPQGCGSFPFTIRLEDSAPVTMETTHDFVLDVACLNYGTLQFSLASFTVNENGGSALITVTRSGGSSGAVGVIYATGNGTAIAGSDYTAVSGTLSWPDGDTSNKTFSIPIINDSSYEGDETVNLMLSNPTGGTTLGSQSTAVLTIVEDDPSNYIATRTLPSYYAPGNPVTVTITITPNQETKSYAVEDSLPVGWAISEISNSGLWVAAENKVKWGPFFDHNSRTLTFKATPPAGETGSKTFNGTASFDGNNIPITGDTSISLALLHQADTSGDYRIVIDEVTAYGAAWKKGQPWSTPPNPIPIEYVTNAGYIWKTSEIYRYDPSQSPPWVPGSFINATFPLLVGNMKVSLFTRTLPDKYTPMVPQDITITINPDTGVVVYAIEDIPPAGWLVSDINEGGSWDDINKKVKWGPFFDNTPRTLTYKATPPAGESGSKTFTGTASFDGSNLPITGETTITENSNTYKLFLPSILR